MSEIYCAIYDAGNCDLPQEEGSRIKCEAYISACQSAYDKPLTIKPKSEVRALLVYEDNIITGYKISN